MHRRVKGYCRERHPGLSFDLMCLEFSNLYEFETLGFFARGRLYILLSEIPSSMQFRSYLDNEVSEGQAKRELAKLRSSLHILAAFGDKGSRRAKRAIETALIDWTKNEKRGFEIPDFFYDQRRGLEDWLDVDAALRQFYTTVELLKRTAKAAEKSIFSWPTYMDGLPPQRWLIGYELPRIYEHVFKRRIKLTLLGRGPTGSGPGIEFIKAGLKFTGQGGTQSDATIKAHVEKVRRAYAASNKMMP